MPHYSTRYLAFSDMQRLVEARGPVEILKGITQNLREDFARWADFEQSPRTANHTPNGVIELMPVSDRERFSFKYVNGHPDNIQRGLMTVMAFGVLAEMESGWPLMLSEMTLLTAFRTAAASAFAAQLLARPDSKSMAIIGAGAQSEFQILAFHHLLGIQDIRIYDTDQKAVQKVLHNLKGLDACLLPCSNTKEAVTGADIVTTCTADKRYAIILHDDLVELGMHINAVGGDCPGKTELDKAILERSKVFVEFEPQSRIEGEIQQMPLDFKVTELYQVLANPTEGRTNPSDITIFDSVGIALEDFSSLRFVYDEAIRLGIGSELELIPQLRNVKNLYGEALLKTQTMT